MAVSANVVKTLMFGFDPGFIVVVGVFSFLAAALIVALFMEKNG